ncbi:MAG TPA: DUF4097 family beta strand repeat-containing protein [Vicinamibacterales bacterium]|nr:DUF4097 family beta strand repeat-containing protein [Vicinamibacterales bacterium]
MKAFIILIAAAATLAPAAAGAQERDRPRLQAQARDRARALAQARASQGREEQTEKSSRTLKIGAKGELDLSNLAGDIVVTRGGGGAAQVEVVKVARGRTVEDAREMLAVVTVDFLERGSRAEVRAYPRRDQRTRNNRNVSVSVHYNVTAPEGTSIAAHSLSGNIRVTDIKGDLNLSSLSGDVSVVNGARVMTAKSTSGKVEIANLRSDIALAANTVSGDLVIRQSRVPRMDLGTVSGNVLITDVDCERIDAHTLSGDVEFSSPLARNGRYELNSHSGVIRIMPTGDTGFEVDVNSFSGSIESSLTLKDQRRGVAASGRRSPGGRTRSLSGVYGDGSATLDITTFSGSVIIGKK